MTNKLIIVGGFLGAGKTSLLFELAKKFKAEDINVGLITNDQASNLVDTTFLEIDNDIVKEVSGSCFCCNFGGFEEALDYISKKNDDEGIIIAEPVGSCTDLSATIMQPLKEKFATKYALKALTVLADPDRLRKTLQDHSSPADYIVYKQFEEADIIVINKSDLLSEEELANLIKETETEFKGTPVLAISVKENKGIDEWLNLLEKTNYAGRKIVEVDYDTYADGEAAFGWLNASFNSKAAEDYKAAGRNFITSLGKRFDALDANIGHVKFLIQDTDKTIIGNLTGRSKTIVLRTEPKGSDKVTLTVNARVEMDPGTLEKIVLEEVHNAFSKYEVEQTALKCLIPGRPNPTYRYNKIVE